MSGIVNSTGARSGLIGTTVGTPASKVVQVVQYATAGQHTRTSATFRDLSTAFQKSITITAGNSILIQVALTISIKGRTEIYCRLYDATLSAVIGTEGSDGLFGATNPGPVDAHFGNVCHNQLYTPGSGTVHDIHAYFKCNGTNIVTINNRAYGDNGYGRLTSTLTLTELAA